MAFKCYARLVAGVVLLLAGYAAGHGRLMEPVGRSSMWRVGYQTPINLNDDRLWCGGFDELWDVDNGTCGICGDDYIDPTPRDNEMGGKYGNGIIVRNFTAGQDIDVTINVTINHLGYFEFRLCPSNDFTTETTQDCLDQHLLELADGSGTRFTIPTVDNEDPVQFNIKVTLPDDVTCFQCLFQWHWWTESSTGTCPDGSVARGCGPQEVFRGCSDVSIQ